MAAVAVFSTGRLLLLELLTKLLLRRNPRSPAETSSQLQAASVAKVAIISTGRLLLLELLTKLLLRRNPRSPAETSSQLQAASVAKVAIIPTLRLLLDMPVEGVTHMCRLFLLSRDMDCLTSPHLTSPHHTSP
jgi:hypothetical protein